MIAAKNTKEGDMKEGQLHHDSTSKINSGVESTEQLAGTSQQKLMKPKLQGMAGSNVPMAGGQTPNSQQNQDNLQ